MTALAPAPRHFATQTTAPVRKLRRPGPRLPWDPLSVDAEGDVPRDVDAPLAHLDPVPDPTDMSEHASILTRAIAEVLLGTRPPSQVQPWLCEDVWHVVRRRADLGRRAARETAAPRGVRILRVHPCQIDERTCEVSVVLHDGTRVRAAALRLALHHQRWRAAAIRIG